MKQNPYAQEEHQRPFLCTAERHLPRLLALLPFRGIQHAHDKGARKGVLTNVTLYFTLAGRYPQLLYPEKTIHPIQYNA